MPIDMTCPFSSDTGTLALTGIVGAAHAAAMVISPKCVADKMLENPKDEKSLHALTRGAGAMAGAAAITALALSQKEDAAMLRRAALAAQGAAMVSVAAIQGMETKNERTKKRIGWASTAIHGGVGAVCLWRGLKEGVGK